MHIGVLGRRDRLPEGLAAAEAPTRDDSRLHLRIALDDSARDAILAAAREEFGRLLAPDGAPEMDLVIRASVGQRISDFLLWERACAESHFTRGPWPDFGEAETTEAMTAFRGRQRRFGGVSVVACGGCGERAEPRSAQERALADRTTRFPSGLRSSLASGARVAGRTMQLRLEDSVRPPSRRHFDNDGEGAAFLLLGIAKLIIL